MGYYYCRKKCFDQRLWDFGDIGVFDVCSNPHFLKMEKVPDELNTIDVSHNKLALMVVANNNENSESLYKEEQGDRFFTFKFSGNTPNVEYIPLKEARTTFLRLPCKVLPLEQVFFSEKSRAEKRDREKARIIAEE